MIFEADVDNPELDNGALDRYITTGEQCYLRNSPPLCKMQFSNIKIIPGTKIKVALSHYHAINMDALEVVEDYQKIPV
ncbi:hypothetical protein [Fodinibius halophilus]|uniref:Uncharacterized protein n=1 Tax=Fodinibius halophilus TaxID=1736908 RepID=A0A6M1SXF7_9BACT|nr:hypothetical protein [Fodinibius halophilus]NGP88588.1 hypothetical protein [Fodinibius halophilus]